MNIIELCSIPSSSIGAKVVRSVALLDGKKTVARASTQGRITAAAIADWKHKVNRLAGKAREGITVTVTTEWADPSGSGLSQVERVEAKVTGVVERPARRVRKPAAHTTQRPFAGIKQAMSATRH